MKFLFMSKKQVQNLYICGTLCIEVNAVYSFIKTLLVK